MPGDHPDIHLDRFVEGNPDDDSDPLRYLMNSNDLNSSPVLPPQLPSVLNETTQLAFLDKTGGYNHKDVLINLVLDASPGCGGITWAAGEVLSAYLVRRGPEFMTGRTVLELGSGTGLVGLVAATLGGKVWITDQAPLLDIMHQNVLLNNLSSSVTVSELNWGQSLPIGIPCLDLILAADCVYFEPAFPLLVQTLSDLAESEKTEILFCYKKRRKADKRFFALLKKKFIWTEVIDDPDRLIYARDAISLLKLTRRR